MIAEIGHYALWLALALAVVQFCSGLWGAHRQDGRLMQVAHRATLLQAAMMVVHGQKRVSELKRENFAV